MTHTDLPVLPVLEAHGLVKVYGSVVALDQTDFAVYPGEVLAVIGDNGAGKSTLVRCLSAAELPDGGTVRLNGAVVRFRTSREARTAGINAVFQSVDAESAIDIATNLYRDREQAHPGPFGKALLWLESKGMRRSAAASDSKVILLDEPTAALGLRESAKVRTFIEHLRGRGLPVVVVSHSIPQVLEIADRDPRATPRHAGCGGHARQRRCLRSRCHHERSRGGRSEGPDLGAGSMIVVGGEALVDLVIDPDGAVTAKLGGGPFNAARTIGRLGGEVAFLGALSGDRFGSLLHRQLLDDDVDDSLLQFTELPTTLAAAELDEHGAATYHFYFAETAAPNLHPLPLPSSVTILHVGTLGMVLEPMANCPRGTGRQHRQRCAGDAGSQLPATRHARSSRLHRPPRTDAAARRCRQGQHRRSRVPHA